jgi:hypothetical protein
MTLPEPDTLTIVSVNVGQAKVLIRWDRDYPDLVRYPALATKQEVALLVRGRDLSGGVPETH